ncbi:proteasome assembly chaperone 2 [Carex littledalei]|uniref:Proteasome assembly chaperone 2 n=1 Tax=Carex littledalei TaxID=544730 RepID=A0A833QRH4_9POAL|nr:proteasome assembly chaperone 2 [Carex littledalei]
MEFAAEEGQSFSPDCPALLLPALSIGNVGQFATDLLISSVRAKRVGYLDEPSVLPCVGNDAFAPVPQGDLSLSLEAYESALHGLTLIQQRSPVIKGMMISFARNMADFIHSIGKNHVLILSSLDSGRRKRIDASSNMQIYYLSSVSDDGSNQDCENLGWKKLDKYDPCQRRWKYLESLAGGASPDDEELITDEEEFTESDYYASLPFSALFTCLKAKGLKVTCLLCYCSEGDNISDSFQLAHATCKLLGLNPEKFHGNEGGGWMIPLSWKSVYGPPPDMTLF